MSHQQMHAGTWYSLKGKPSVFLSGPSSNITFVPYAAGNQNFGIRFKPGIVFTHIPVAGMVNITKALPMPTDATFVLQGITWGLPTYENIDEFLTVLVEKGLIEKFKEWTDPARELPEDAVDIDQLLTNVSIYWFGRGGAGAAHFLYESMHAAAAWGLTHNRPVGFVSFGSDPLVRRMLDPEHRIAYWNEHDRGGHFPAMEAPQQLVDDIRAFFLKLNSKVQAVETVEA